MKGICKLCQSHVELIKKSHIFPDFIYRDARIYDEKHKLYKVGFDIENKIIKEQFLQSSGEFEKNILCQECDGVILSKYENYGKKFLFGKDLPAGSKFLYVRELRSFKCLNVDYGLFKLFLLSLLWRAHISTRPFFNEVNLRDHDEEIRMMLLKGNPKKESDYPIFFMHTLYDKKFSKDQIFQPIPAKIKDTDGFFFFISGILIIFSLSSIGVPEKLFEFSLKENGTIKMLTIPPGESWNYIFKYLLS